MSEPTIEEKVVSKRTGKPILLTKCCEYIGVKSQKRCTNQKSPSSEHFCCHHLETTQKVKKCATCDKVHRRSGAFCGNCEKFIGYNIEELSKDILPFITKWFGDELNETFVNDCVKYMVQNYKRSRMTKL